MKTSTSDLPLTLMIKLGSLVVHLEEFLSPGGHDVDRVALQTLLDDSEIKAWLKTIDPAFLPVKR